MSYRGVSEDEMSALKHTHESLPREYSNRSQGKILRSVTASTKDEDFYNMIRKEYLIKQVEGMNNIQKVRFAGFFHFITNSKHRDVYGDTVKSVGEYARLYGDADWNTADYLELNKRFRNRVDPYVYLRAFVSQKVMGINDIKQLLMRHSLCCVVDNSKVGINGYRVLITRSALQSFIEYNTITTIRVDIDGENDSRFLGTIAEWQWLLDSGKKFKAYSK